MCLYFFLAALTVAAHAEGVITGLKVSEGANTVKIDIASNGSVQHRTKTQAQPGKAIIVDVFPAKLGSGVKTDYAVNRGLVSNVHVKQYTDNTVRITVDAISLPEYKVTTGAGNQGLTLNVSTSTIAEGKPSTNPVAVAEPKAAPETPAPKVAAPPKVTPAPVHKNTEPVKVLTNRTQPKTTAVAQPKAVVYTGGGGQTVDALRPRVAPRRTRPYQKMVSLDFVNADLVYVIKVLAKEMGKNVYVGPGVEGSVTVTLKKVPVEGALALILKMQENEFAYKLVEPNTIVVAPPEKLNSIADTIMIDNSRLGPTLPKNPIRQEILLENAQSAKVMSFLESQYKNVKFQAHPTVNGFYATGSKEDVLQIKREIPNLDKVPPAPAKPEREFVRVNYGDLAEIKGLLATLVPDVIYNVDQRRNTLILEGSPSAIENVKEMLAEIDKPVDQVMVDVKVVDLSENGRKALGMTWGSGTGALGIFNTTLTEGTLPDRQDFLPSGANTQFTTQRLDIFNPLTRLGMPLQGFTRSAYVISNSLQLVQESGEAKIMATPRVGMISGKPSLIHIGDKFPIVYFDPRAGQFQVQYVDIGIKLDVKADVKGDGNVECELTPEVSTLVSLVNNQYPRTAVRRIQTTMRVKDGETIVVGGLIREEDNETVSKIPLLGDLPLIGAFFRNINANRNRNEVVVMLTPTVMR